MKRAMPWVLMLMTGVAAAQGLAPANTEPNANVAGERAEDAVVAADAIAKLPSETNARIDNMLIHALSLIGVKYQYGGNSSEKGFDCSGFVRHVFAETMAMDLPRSSYGMSRLGAPVGKGALQPGDLLFYNTLKRHFSHVAIYLGEGRFVHAPSRGKSVEIVDMTDAYWVKRFNGARRMTGEK
ncbi:MAG: C40 family peptidase [Betaproteobacteria bacterium]